MRIQRFAARTAAEAMAAVKQSLGPDAVLLETRRIQAPERRAAGELVEVVAAVDRNPGRRRRVYAPARPSFDALLAHAEDTDAARADGQGRVDDGGLVGRHGRPEVEEVTSAARAALPGGQGPSPHRPSALGHPAPAPVAFAPLATPVATPPATAAPAPAPVTVVPAAPGARLALLERRLDSLAQAVHRLGAPAGLPGAVVTTGPTAVAGNELVAVTAALIALDRKVDALLATAQAPAPVAAGEVDARLLAELAVAGLDPLAARHWGERVQATYTKRPATPGETPLMRLAAELGQQITCAPEAGPGEVHCLLGASGAGKSTLVVKLALRAQQLDRLPVHLITLDYARPEGAALLARYAEVFALPLTRVSDVATLGGALDRLPAGGLTLVDCPATSVDVEQRPALAALLRALGPHAVRHLLLPAATALAEMRRQVAAHRTVGIDRLAFTKVDEAAAFGQVAAIAAESGLPVSWLTTGRQIPEDLADAGPDLLAALVTRRRSATAAVAGNHAAVISKNPPVATCVSDKEQR